MWLAHLPRCLLHLSSCCRGEEENLPPLQGVLCRDREPFNHPTVFQPKVNKYELREGGGGGGRLDVIKCLNVYQCRVGSLPQLSPHIQPGFLACLPRVCGPNKVADLSCFYEEIHSWTHLSFVRLQPHTHIFWRRLEGSYLEKRQKRETRMWHHQRV